MSHHFDSPTAIEDGRLNLLDVYVFPEAPRTSTLVLTVNPDSGRSSPTTFRADALYEFVIASDGGTAEDRAFRMSFGEPDAGGDQEMRVRYAAGESSRSGLEGTELGVGRTGQLFALGNGGSAWFGPACDPFWGDAPSLFAFIQGLAKNQYRPELFTATPDNLLAATSPPSPFRSRTSRSAAPRSACGHGSPCTGTVPSGRSAGRPIRCCGRCSSRSAARTPRRSTPVRPPATSPRSARPYGRPRSARQD